MKSFPDEEGIKTAAIFAHQSRLPLKSFPDEEGIKTLLVLTLLVVSTPLKSFPDEEGIKTNTATPTSTISNR